MEQNKEAPFAVCVCNFREYAEGMGEGVWAALPQEKEQLDSFIRSRGGEEQLMILDASVREDCAFMKDYISEWANIRQLNAAAGLIGDAPHPAAEAYLEASGRLTLEEPANLLLQEGQIPNAQGPDLSFYRMEEILEEPGERRQEAWVSGN